MILGINAIFKTPKARPIKKGKLRRLIGNGESPKAKGERVSRETHAAIRDNAPICVLEISKLTGASQGGIRGIIARLEESKSVTSVQLPVKGSTRPVKFFSLVA